MSIRNKDSQLLMEAYTNSNKKRQLVEQITSLTMSHPVLLQEFGALMGGLGSLGKGILGGLGGLAKGAASGLGNVAGGLGSLAQGVGSLGGKALGGVGNVVGAVPGALGSGLNALAGSMGNPPSGVAPATEGELPEGLPEGELPDGLGSSADAASPQVQDTVNQVLSSPVGQRGTPEQAAQMGAQMAKQQGATGIDVNKIIELIRAIKTGNAPAAQGGAPAAQGGAPAAQGGAPAAQGGAPAAQGGAPDAMSQVKKLLDQLDIPKLQQVLGQLQVVAQQIQQAAPAQAAPAQIALTQAAPAQVAQTQRNPRIGFEDYRKLKPWQRQQFQDDVREYEKMFGNA